MKKSAKLSLDSPLKLTLPSQTVVAAFTTWNSVFGISTRDEAGVELLLCDIHREQPKENLAIITKNY